MVNVPDADFEMLYALLANEAFDGLREYYPEALTEANRASIIARVRPAYRASGSNQRDYEALRDAIERSVAWFKPD